MSINYKDLWAFIQNKITHEGENVFKIPSSAGTGLKDQRDARKVIQSLENEELEALIKDMETILEDQTLPSEERLKAERALKLLKLRPL